VDILKVVAAIDVWAQDVGSTCSEAGRGLCDSHGSGDVYSGTPDKRDGR
jgi:hypothetical protein